MHRVARLHAALIDAFTIEDLNQMLTYSFNKRLEDFTNSNALKSEQFLDVIDSSIANGWFYELANEARNSNPGNEKLNAFYQDFVRPWLSEHTLKTERVKDVPSEYLSSKNHGGLAGRIRDLEVIVRGPDGRNGLRDKYDGLQRRQNLIIAMIVLQTIVLTYFLR